MERISRCISLRSWLRSRRWMKLERTALSAETFEKGICAVRQPKNQDNRSVTAAGALVTIVSPLRTAATERIKCSSGGRDKNQTLRTCATLYLWCALSRSMRSLHGNLGMGFIVALREGRGSRGLRWDKPSMGRLAECVSRGCYIHITVLSLSGRLYLGNKIAWVWTL